MYFIIKTRTVLRQVGDTRYARTTEVNWVLPSSLQLRLANLLKVTWLQAGQGTALGFPEEQQPQGD